MVDSKLLALAFNKDVPAEVKAAGKAHLVNLQRIEKAEAKMNEARDEKKKAQAASEESDKALSEVLAKWIPAVEVQAAAK